MIEPAILYKEELAKAFNRELYTDRYFYYEGGIELNDYLNLGSRSGKSLD